MILGNFIISIASILDMIITAYTWIIIIAALITWVRPDPYNPIVQTLYKLTNPVYDFIRRFIPTVIGGIDLAPIIVILALKFIQLFLIQTLVDIARAL